MKINIKGDNALSLQIPTGLALNGLTATLLAHQLQKKGIAVSAGQIRRFLRAAKQYKKSHPEWMLVQAGSAKGEEICIRL